MSALGLALLAVGAFGIWLTSLTRHAWPNRLARAFARRLGWTPLYHADGADWKDQIWEYRYDDLDGMAMRPIHPDMSVAPPWARRFWVRNEHVKAMLEHRETKRALIDAARNPKPRRKP